MKRSILLFVAVAFAVNLFGQNWEFRSVESNFDGAYKFAGVIGKGEFPYNSPTLFARIKGGHREIFFSKVVNAAGDNLNVKIKIDNVPEVLEFTAETSKDNEVWFLSTTEAEFDSLVAMFKNGGSVAVRLISDYSTDDYLFSLNGSTTAINKLMK